MNLAKHKLTLAFLPILLATPGLLAAKPVEIRWADLCQEAADRKLIATTTQGEIRGDCASTRPDHLVIMTGKQGPVRIARSELSRLRIRRKQPPAIPSIVAGALAGLVLGVAGCFVNLDDLLGDGNESRGGSPKSLLIIPLAIAGATWEMPHSLWLDAKYAFFRWQEVRLI